MDAQRRLELEAAILRHFVARLIAARFMTDAEAEELVLNEDTLVSVANTHAKTDEERSLMVTYLHDLAAEIDGMFRSGKEGKGKRKRANPALRLVPPTDQD